MFYEETPECVNCTSLYLKKNHSENDLTWNFWLSQLNCFYTIMFLKLLEPVCVRVCFHIAWSWENTFM